MDDIPSYPADQEQRILDARACIAKMMNVAAASQQESHELIAQTNFVAAPSLPGANYILSRMAKWERLLSDHRHKSWDYFEQYGIADYNECAELACLDLQDFLSFVRNTKAALSSPQQSWPMQQPAPNASQGWAPQGAPPAPPGLDMQLQQMMERQRIADMKALQEAQKATNAANRAIVQERMAQATRHSERVRSVL